MDKWPIVGALMVVGGVAILVLLAGFILKVLVFILDSAAVFIGILLVLGGLALLFGRKWMRRSGPRWGPSPANT